MIFFEKKMEGPSNLHSNFQKSFTKWLNKLPILKSKPTNSVDVTSKEKPGKELKDEQDAQFVGWQKTPSGEFFAIYNIIVKKHPQYRSTVSEKTLREQNLKVPPTPPLPKDLKKFDPTNNF